MIAEARTEGEPLGEEDPDMKETESMLILMQQIQQMRENNKGLADEERRKNAEALIL